MRYTYLVAWRYIPEQPHHTPRSVHPDPIELPHAIRGSEDFKAVEVQIRKLNEWLVESDTIEVLSFSRFVRPSAGTPITCLVDGQEHSGRIVRFEDATGQEPSKVVLTVADDGYANEVSFPESAITVCPKCFNHGMIMEDDYIEKDFCDCPAGQDLLRIWSIPSKDNLR